MNDIGLALIEISRDDDGQAGVDRTHATDEQLGALLARGLALVIASRLTIAQMNERGRGLLDVGSPFFNHFIELRLRPFSENSVDLLLSRSGDALSIDDRHFVASQ